MRIPVLLACLLFPVAPTHTRALAQTTSTDPANARYLPNSGTVAAAQDATRATRSTTLTSGVARKDAPVSRNEAYNIARAAEGRVGVRMGNDVSFPVGERVGDQP